MSNKNSFDRFLALARRALSVTSIRELVSDSSYDEMIAFQQVYLRLMEMDVNKKTRNLMEDRHPFVKVGGRWRVSMVKLYLFLVAARPAMLKTGNRKMFDLYDAVQNMQGYIEEAKALDQSLTPKGHQNYDEYQEKQSELYELAMLKQKSIFDRMAA